MKKFITFIPLMLIILFVFACDLNFKIPNAVEIKGTPSLTIGTNLDLSKILSEVIMDAFGEIDYIHIHECINVNEQLTYIISVKFDAEFSIPDGFLDDMFNLVGETVNDLIVSHDLFTGIDEVIDVDALDTFLDILLDGLELDGLDIPNQFSWAGVNINLNVENILDNFFDGTTKEELKQTIIDAESSSATIANIIKDTVVDIVIETVKSTAIEITDDIFLPGIDQSIALPLDNIDDMLRGFTFSDELKARVYLSLTDQYGDDIEILDLIAINLNFNSSDVDDLKLADLESETSGLDYSTNVYTETELPKPNAGIELEDTILALFNSDDNVEIDFDVFIPKGKTISLNSLLDKEFNVSAELVIWLPIKVIASSGNEFILPVNLPEFNLFTDYITSIEFAIEFSGDVFDGVTLTLASDNLDIHFPMSGSKLEFKLDQDKINDINSQTRFAPDIKIKYVDGASLQIPRGFSIKSISFKAGLNIRIPQTVVI